MTVVAVAAWFFNLFKQFATPGHQIIMFLVPQTNEAQLYMSFKQICMDKGLPNQCIKSKTLGSENYCCLSPILVKMVAQINAKLCGKLWGILGVGFN